MDDVTKALLGIIAADWPAGFTMEDAAQNAMLPDDAVATLRSRFGSATIGELAAS